MSELKAITAYEANWKAESYGDNRVLVYLKSAADKVIAELKESHKKEAEQLLILNRKLKSDIADLRDDKKLTDTILDERNTEIAKLKDKCQMHNFFWDGCGFAKRGFKNSIAVSVAFDDLEAENAKLKDKLRHYPVMAALIDCGNKEIRHQKYKRCLAMAKWCFTKSNYHFVLARHGEDAKENNRRSILYSKWRKRWLKLAEKFKEAK